MRGSKYFIIVLLVYLIAVLVVLATKADAEYVTSENGLRLRKQPSLEAEVIRVLPFGTEVEGTEKDGWFETEQGFLKSEYISKNNPLEDYECLGLWTLTAYYETGNATASGVYPSVGTTLAHNTLPFGTELYIEGYGTWIVQDRGPTSMGSEWADLYLGDYDECIQFGVREARVYTKKTP